MRCIVCSKNTLGRGYYAIKNDMRVGFCEEHYKDCKDCDSFLCEFCVKKGLIMPK